MGGNPQIALLFLPFLLFSASAQLHLPFITYNPFPFDPFRLNQPQEPQRQPEQTDADLDGPAGVATVQPEYNTGFDGDWKIVTDNAGVSAMHMAVTHENRVIMFDDTNLGPSQVPLPPGDKCRPVPGDKPPYPVIPGRLDCFAHGVDFDPETGRYRPLHLLTDTWCSSGGFGADGTLVQSGGWADGGQSMRYICSGRNCDFVEYPMTLSQERWYSTQQILPDGQHVVIGGRRGFSYEYVPKPGAKNPTAIPLSFLEETTDKLENNLYPFVHLNTDGNLFLFANDRAILFNPSNGEVIKRYPVLKGGARNYPGSGMSVLLPLDLSNPEPEVLVCGGSDPAAFELAMKGNFPPAIQSCGRLKINDPNPQWAMENMPMPRTISDMLILPNEEILMINGASKGCAGWDFARDPVLNPVLYRYAAAPNARFTVLKKTNIPRMYHAASAVLPDTSILVAGSNTNDRYKFVNVMYPTELRVEKFYPPYFDTALAANKPDVAPNAIPGNVRYGAQVEITFGLGRGFRGQVDETKLKVTMYPPPFTTHGYSMNQRLLVLRPESVQPAVYGQYSVSVTMPASGKIAPPGYYMVFVVYQGIPSKASWVRIN